MRAQNDMSLYIIYNLIKINNFPPIYCAVFSDYNTFYDGGIIISHCHFATLCFLLIFGSKYFVIVHVELTKCKELRYILTFVKVCCVTLKISF
jgi:hypothetical protein